MFEVLGYIDTLKMRKIDFRCVADLLASQMGLQWLDWLAPKKFYQRRKSRTCSKKIFQTYLRMTRVTSLGFLTSWKPALGDYHTLTQRPLCLTTPLKYDYDYSM